MILVYVLFLNDYLWCSYSLILNFILKIIFFCIFIFFFFILIKSNKQVDTFNKCVGLRLRNLDPFNKHVELVLTYVVELSWLDTTQTRHVNTNCHPYLTGSQLRISIMMSKGMDHCSAEMEIFPLLFLVTAISGLELEFLSLFAVLCCSLDFSSHCRDEQKENWEAMFPMMLLRDTRICTQDLTKEQTWN